MDPTTSAQRARSLAARLLAVTVLLAAVALSTVVLPDRSARAAGCQAPSIVVIVSLTDEHAMSQCVDNDQAATGLLALEVHLNVELDARASVCQIQATPKSNDCHAKDPAGNRVWSYWFAQPGDTSWTFMTAAPAEYRPAPGSAMWWVLGGSDTEPTYRPQNVLPEPASPISSGSPQSSVASTSSGAASTLSPPPSGAPDEPTGHTPDPSQSGVTTMASATDVTRTVESAGPPTRSDADRMLPAIVLLAAIGALLAVGGWWLWQRRQSSARDIS